MAEIKRAYERRCPDNGQTFAYEWSSGSVTTVISSDARKICRAFDAADERDSTEIGI